MCHQTITETCGVESGAEAGPEAGAGVNELLSEDSIDLICQFAVPSGLVSFVASPRLAR